MDVISLLNSSAGQGLKRRDSVASSTPSATGDTTAPSTAVHTPSPRQSPSRRSSGSRSPARNQRMVWDANGFRLPELTIDTKSIPSPPIRRPTYCSDSPTDGHASVSPNSPGHKYSNSHSSLSSSYTSSSTNSGSHSRISSLSTVSEFQPLGNLTTDISLENSSFSSNNFSNNFRNKASKKMASEKLDVSTSGRPTSSGDGEPRRQTRVQRLQREQPIDLDADERPESPSDAVMIRRGQAGRSDSGSPDPIEAASTQNISPARNDSRNESRDNSPSSIHRRAISAPDLVPNDNPTANQPAPAHTSGQPSELRSLTALPGPSGAPAPALAPMQGTTMGNIPYCFGLPAEIINHVVPRIFPTVDELIKEIDIYAERTCKYMDDCLLIKNLPVINWRKAMSHMFGRNKNCTRSIPDLIWSCFCRKHYQRARYRNNHEYNKRLCILIEIQILRILVWSLENIRLGTPENGVVRDWALTCRRREQMRIEEVKSKKRSHEDDDSDDDFDGPIPSGNTAQVPQWLLDLCRPGYSTLEILRIVARIGDDMNNGALTQLPDIEFLPNITGENAKPKSKSRAKAKAPAAHRRAQSMGNAAQGPGSLTLSSPRRVSQPTSFLGARGSGNGYRQDDDSRPTSKRQRFSETEEEDEYENAHADSRFPPRTLGRTVPNVRHLPALTPHGPRFNEELAPQPMQYGYGAPTSGPGPLPAPRPSQYNYAETANSSRNLGASYDDYRARAPQHQRAFSDAASTGSNNFSWPSNSTAGTAGMQYADQQPNGYSGFYPPATTGYTSYTRGEYAPARHENTGYAPTQGYYQQQQQAAYHPQQAHGYYGPPGGGVKHMRHQSTPVGLHPQQQQRMMGPPPPPAQQAYDPAAYYGRHQSYGGMPSSMPARDNVAREAETGSGDVGAPTPNDGYEGYPAGGRR